MRKLSLSEWASVAEIIGAIAVVLSSLNVGVPVQYFRTRMKYGSDPVTRRHKSDIV